MVVFCELHHGGVFEHYPTVRYVNGKVLEMPIDLDRCSIAGMKNIGRIMGYSNIIQIFCKLGSEEDFEEGITGIGDEKDALKFATRVKAGDIIQVYLEHGVDNAVVIEEEEEVVHVPLLMNEPDTQPDVARCIDEYDVEGSMPVDDQTPGVVLSPIHDEVDQVQTEVGESSVRRAKKKMNEAQVGQRAQRAGKRARCGASASQPTLASQPCEPRLTRQRAQGRGASASQPCEPRLTRQRAQGRGASASQPSEHVDTTARGRGHARGCRGRGQ